MSKSIGKRLFNEIQKKDLKISQIAKALNLQRGAIYKWIKGENDIKAGYLETLCSQIGVSIEYLVTGVHKPKVEQQYTKQELLVVEALRHVDERTRTSMYQIIGRLK